MFRLATAPFRIISSILSVFTHLVGLVMALVSLAVACGMFWVYVNFFGGEFMGLEQFFLKGTPENETSTQLIRDFSQFSDGMVTCLVHQSWGNLSDTGRQVISETGGIEQLPIEDLQRLQNNISACS